ncbi:hypothetical protein ACMHYJ_03535 [Castellaniella hirudinis]|uniref:hypothetical protein n=1 Tax=Castellaniella hirudinis TaxID=1144617 RepID=UPI0039C22C05
MQIPDIDSTTLGSWAAGVLGAALSMQWVKGFTWQQRLAMVATGTASAALLTWPIMEFVGMPPGWVPGMSFLVGLFGWAGLGGVMHTLQKADWWGLIQDIVRRFFNRGS